MKFFISFIILSLCAYAGYHFKASLAKEVVTLWGLSARQGKRTSMEDAHTHELSFGNKKSDAFFAIYDGHGGCDAAEYAAQNLYMNYLADNQLDVLSCIKEAYEQTEKEIIHKFDSGCTALTLYIKNTIAYIAWSGDSRGMIVRQGEPLFVTQDHKPNMPSEKKRIESLGQQVKMFGVPRILGLAVSRALGDRSIKKMCPGAVIATPEVKKSSIKSRRYYHTCM